MLNHIETRSGAQVRSRRPRRDFAAAIKTITTLAATAVLATSLAALSGCGMSPGMTAPSSVTQAKAATDAARTSGNNDAPPPNALVEINSALVAKEAAARSTTVPMGVEKLFGTPKPYTLGPGDVLSIVVWDHPEMNLPTTSASNGNNQNDQSTNQVVSGYTVDSSGTIQVAYVGPIHVAGLTELEARNLVAKKLSYYLQNPQVTLRIEAYRSRRVYVDGEVRTPGLMVLNDMTMSLPEAINRAGGFTGSSDRSRVSITRGKQTIMVNIPDMIRKGVNPDNIILQNGDLVRVYSSNDTKVYVLGEVGRPGSLPLDNGRLTLNEALGNAGGISQGSGDASQVYVVRGQKEGQRTVFHLDASTPEAMATADQFELKPSDVVFVDASSLVKWSRVVNLILPSTQAASAGRYVGAGY
ncbi:polysaccharide biosynthesis/export family protein [Paraburkholderia sp. J41]|uniref:polysaccharide biosynthesis/export family protein n=1 Tax=Paraburkholderia sp. J41 TaxID=2805433 RepID=UPI002AC33B6E|nr:polysaccharide biosynthesis/export family protein [Paraburkholderia sp. J41]